MTKSFIDSALLHFWKSPWTLWIGLRYLKSKKNSRFLSLITLLSIGGVGLGVTSMLVVLSVMDGFEMELKKRMMSGNLHIMIQPPAHPQPVLPPQEGPEQGEGAPVFQFQGQYGFVTNQILNEVQLAYLREDPRMTEFFPVIATEAILKTGRKITGIVLKGVTAEKLKSLKKQVIETADPQLLSIHQGLLSTRLPGVYLGQELAYELGLIPGDQISLISPLETEGPLESIPRVKKYVIEAIYQSGLPEQELHVVFASNRDVESFLRKSDILSHWEVNVKQFDDAPSVANRIRDYLPSTFKVQDWRQMNAHLFASLRLERISMFVILTVIIIVASFNIVTTLTLMVLEKKKEISILKAMGTRNPEVAAIFLAEGLFIGLLGVLGGGTFGFFICLALRRYEFITLPDIFYDRTLPVTFDIRYYILVTLSALAIVIVACLYPSKRAGQLTILEGIRLN